MPRSLPPVAALVQARRACARPPESFESDAALLRTARVLCALRAAAEEEPDESRLAEAARIERKLARVLHDAIARSRGVHLAEIVRRQRLSRAECEVLLVLALSEAGMVPRVQDIDDVQKALGRDRRDALSVVRALSPDGRLAGLGLVEVDDTDETVMRSITVSDAVLDPIIGTPGAARDAWNVKTYDEYLDRLYTVFSALERNAQDLAGDQRTIFGRAHGPPSSVRGRVRRHLRLARQTARRHPSWPVRLLFDDELYDGQQKILVVLVAKELGFQRPDSDVFTGEGIARCICDCIPDIRHALKHLGRSGTLRKGAYIRLCGGRVDATVEDETTLRTSEFELTTAFRERLKLPCRRRSRNTAREPVVAMSQLVLGEGVRRALDMVVAHVEHATVLLDDWGLAGAVPYGSGVTVLFGGPPGVGKTACAEAIARELGKRILVASYAEIQDCYVGQTEKNIVRAFRDAAEDEAVLFWDEADAMFYSREDATRTWEVRDVNVLLQELERFTGLCILATNRTITLDPAFERRIAIKVEFAPPDRAMRHEIWKRLLPRKLPLAGDVDLTDLARHELTGGEIKNVVLNAARLAVSRGTDTQVTAADFGEAVRMECDGRWSEKGRVGFAPGTAE